MKCHIFKTETNLMDCVFTFSLQTWHLRASFCGTSGFSTLWGQDWDRERERERITTYFPQGACYGMDSHVPPIAGCTGGVGDSDTAEWGRLSEICRDTPNNNPLPTATPDSSLGEHETSHYGKIFEGPVYISVSVREISKLLYNLLLKSRWYEH